MEGKLLYLIAIFLGVALIVFAITSVSNNHNPIDTLKNTIKINGESKLTIMPDEAYIYFTIESKDLNLVSSKQNVDNTWNSIKTQLDSKKIKYETTNYSAQPNYVWNDKTKKSELDGYITIHSLKITLNDLNKTDNVIDTIAINNLTTIDSVGFGLSDSTEANLKAQLWSLAIKDAQNTVKEITNKNGINIKQTPLTIEETNSYIRPYYDMVYSAVESKSSISPKEQDVSLNLDITFELE